LLQVAKPVFDADTYHVLRKAVAKLPHRLLY
jgi:hypothetical protein